MPLLVGTAPALGGEPAGGSPAGGSPVGGSPNGGPAFGTTRYRTEIRHGARDDVDDYVSPLIAGETLAVRVASRGDRSLRPGIVVLDPEGEDRTPELARRPDGSQVAFRGLRIDRSGPWTVRVVGEGGTQGPYDAWFRVAAPRPLTWTRQRLGGAAAPSRAHPFDAVTGATLSATVRSRIKSQSVSMESVEDGHGATLLVGPLRRTGRRTALVRTPLDGAPGTWRATIGIDDGEAEYDLRLRVVPPPRPRGTLRLDPSEPRLPLLARPMEGGPSRSVTLHGGGFSTAPRPAVWFGGRSATVVAATPWSLGVLPPEGPEGAVVDVVVTNPDGQSVRREGYFAYVSPAPVRLAALEPGVASLYAGTTREFTVRLSRSPGYPPEEVAVSASGAVSSPEPTAVVAGSSPSATFLVSAGVLPGEGKVTATLGDVSLTADVRVVALPAGPEPPPLPDEIDLSGWTLRQANSARTFQFPQGVRLVAGDTVVVGRAASRTAFAAYWDVSLGDDVHYLTADPVNSSSTSDDWPSINGSETFELFDAGGNLVDGPTYPMGEFGGQNLQRTPGGPPDSASSWIVREYPYSWATPGLVPPADAAARGVWISEVSDVLGSGNFVFEFVEVRFGGHAEPP